MTPLDDNMRTESLPDDSGSIVRLFSEFVMIPVAAFLYGVDMLLKAMQKVQQVTSQGVEVMVGPSAFPSRSVETGGSTETAPGNSNFSNPTADSKQNLTREDKKLIETSQNFCSPGQKDGKCLILWRYKVLFIKRDFEHAFAEVEDLVPDDVTDITAWKVAEFIQQLGRCEVKVPHKWIDKRYPKPITGHWKLSCEVGESAPSDEELEEAIKTKQPIYLAGLPEPDKQFLRLYAQQLASYTRQDPKYEERQIEVLEDIARKIK